ncbi:COG1361 S-layer family protein [Candidatus Woesearchaeota archaeon]|nr:COG1361 S-layer family protein [Candidatus Woesearchaeota archaeon]
MRKQIVFIGIMLILVIVGVRAIDAPEIEVTLLNQDPDPVGPGEYVEMRFSISNSKQGTLAEDFQVMLDTKYPFSLDSGEEVLRSLGDLPALGATKNVIVVKYRVRVDDNAVEGTNNIRLNYKYRGIDWVGVEFDVNVQTLDANLAIVSVETLPEKIKPGEEAKINIKVKNMADSTLKDVTMKLDLTFSYVLSQVSALTATDSVAAFNALPFAPLGSATEQKIFSLGPGQEYEFSYDLIAFSDAESKIYKVPVQLSYYDELQTQYTKNDVIGLIVGTQPDMSVVIDETDIYVGKRSGTVTVKFINKGFSDIKFLDVTLAKSDAFETICCDEIYIGNVDSDDYETADFKIYLNENGKAEKKIPFKVVTEYRDANNNIYRDEHDLELNIMSPAKLGMQTSSGGFFWVVLLIIAVVVGIWYFRRRKKKK